MKTCPACRKGPIRVALAENIYPSGSKLWCDSDRPCSYREDAPFKITDHDNLSVDVGRVVDLRSLCDPEWRGRPGKLHVRVEFIPDFSEEP